MTYDHGPTEISVSGKSKLVLDWNFTEITNMIKTLDMEIGKV